MPERSPFIGKVRTNAAWLPCHWTHGQEGAGRHRGIERYDSDKEGKISKEEFEAGRRADWEARQDRIAGKRFAKADANQDGVLSGTELKRYKAFDRDGDSQISKDEFEAGLAKSRQKRRKARILGK